jgi:hypothetical protein
MSGFQNKNLIFYSMHPNDKLSRMCLLELDKLPELNKQFIRICIHHPQDIKKPPIINLPPKVDHCKNHGLIPILAIAGFREAITANSALSWIKESALKMDAGIAASNIHGGGVADNCSSITQASQSGNALFDTDYNIGFSDAKGEFNKGYANIDEAVKSRIMTYDEVNDKKAASGQIAQRLENMKFSRDIDVPKAMVGGGMGIPNNGNMSMPDRQQQGMSGMPGMPGMPGNQQSGYDPRMQNQGYDPRMQNQGQDPRMMQNQGQDPRMMQMPTMPHMTGQYPMMQQRQNVNMPQMPNNMSQQRRY